MSSSKKYTTLQIRKEINEIIRDFCKEHGLVASRITENYWINLVSASLSGSISF